MVVQEFYKLVLKAITMSLDMVSDKKYLGDNVSIPDGHRK